MPDINALLSATFHEPGVEHWIEVCHERKPLLSLTFAAYTEQGEPVTQAFMPEGESVRLAATTERVMVTLDARYDPRVFGYRPHHYAWMHRPQSQSPPVYYAVNGILGGTPERLGPTVSRGNHEGYIVPQGTRQCWSLYLGNLSRFAETPVTVNGEKIVLGPKCHTEYPLPGTIHRIDVKAPHRIASYIVGRDWETNDIVLMDHLLAYFK